MKKSQKLKRVQTAIDYTQRTPAVQKSLAKVGFTKADVTQGQVLLGEVQLLDAVKRKEYGERYLATDELTQAKQQARETYIKHLEVARFALKDQRSYWETLELGGTRKTNLFGWLEQAQTFYRNAPLVQAILTRYELTEAELQQGATMLEAVIEAYNVRQKEGAEAQAATQQRNETLARLDDWMRHFTRSARLAFANDPQTLKGLGLISKVPA